MNFQNIWQTLKIHIQKIFRFRKIQIMKCSCFINSLDLKIVHVLKYSSCSKKYLDLNLS
jgi:hypothetical protein